jgi:hypothetical protein
VVVPAESLLLEALAPYGVLGAWTAYNLWEKHATTRQLIKVVDENTRTLRKIDLTLDLRRTPRSDDLDRK